MIELLNGIHETVAFDALHGMKLYENAVDENYPLHWHTALEIIMPVENCYTVIINGQNHLFKEGDIWITSPGTLHELVSPSCGKRLIILFDYSQACNVKGMDSLLHLLNPFTLITSQEYPELNAYLKKLLNEVASEYFTAAPFTEAVVYSLMLRFFAAIGRANLNADTRFPGMTNSKQHEYVEKFMSVCNYITEHCTEDLSIDRLSGVAGFSKFHFTRLFKQFTNMSCYEYLTRKRLEHAQRLLIDPDVTITEAAMQSGFNSLSTFNRIFKANKNCTPSEYKNLNYSNLDKS